MTYRNDASMRETLAQGEHQAWMVRLSDGWSIKVRGLCQYEDGTVEWSHSDGGIFQPQVLSDEKSAGMEKYFVFLDLLRTSGTVNMFGAASYLQQRFVELANDKSRAREILKAWMDSFKTGTERDE